MRPGLNKALLARTEIEIDAGRRDLVRAVGFEAVKAIIALRICHGQAVLRPRQTNAGALHRVTVAVGDVAADVTKRNGRSDRNAAIHCAGSRCSGVEMED